MSNHLKLAVCSALFLLLPAGVGAAEVAEAPEEFVVVGRQPGPPLWKVNNGDKVLWIFPYLSPIPKDMIWESERVARVIEESQEVLTLPGTTATASRLVMFNPINLVRGYRLVKRLTRNPDGGTLEDNLPPELYARFAALQARYFPREDDFEEMRPLVAGGRMTSLIQEEEGLVDGGEILDAIRRLIRRNRDIVRTEIMVSVEIEGGFRDIADRAETMMDSLAPAQEQACFEQQVRHMEEDLDEMKSRANSWAQGYVDEFRNIPLVFDESNACIELIMGSSEEAIVTDLTARLDQEWLDAAEKALATNSSTFAILEINALLRADGLMDKLRARGYEVREP